MVLEIWTARLSTRDPDARDVTRKSGDPIFAPSWPLVRSILAMRRSGRAETDAEWKAYAASYLREMATSYDAHRSHWETLLGRRRVVLTCYCTDAARCHRRVLAKILVKLGATDMGELPVACLDGDETARQLFDLAMTLDDD